MSMKVILFCGGLGTRLREYSATIPKPIVQIGCRPIIWHLMQYYAYYGHTEFVLCLGYRGDLIKQYFVEHADRVDLDAETLEVRPDSGERWKITFADTGLDANIGQRLKRVQHHVADAPIFLANYSDALTDLPLETYLESVRRRDKIASFICVSPRESFHTVSFGRDGLVDDIQTLAQAGVWINGGFFVFKREFFDYLKEGDDLVGEPFRRLIGLRQLTAYWHDGFWRCMDTFKDKQVFDDMEARGDTPWQVWRSPRADRAGNA